MMFTTSGPPCLSGKLHPRNQETFFGCIVVELLKNNFSFTPKEEA